MRILLIDDDKEMLQKLKLDLFAYFSEHYEEVNIDAYSSDFSSLDYSKPYDYAFIDIDLPENNGIEIVKKFKTRQPRMNAVFVSGYANLIHDSLVVQPLYFIRKANYSQDLEKFFEILDHLGGVKKNINLQYRGEFRRVTVEDIIYISVYNHKLTVRTVHEELYDKRTLTEIYELFPKDTFARVSQSYIINMDYLLSYKKGILTMVGGTEINIGRTYKYDFEESFKRYILK